MSRVLLSLVLFIAGVLHLWRPELFEPAIPFATGNLANIFAGVFEILLSLGLWHKRLSDRAAQLCALWFLLLIPIHIYVSWNQIPIFGVTNSFLLWARTLMQPLLYFWALSLQKKGWIMAQTWNDVLFLHYELDPQLLQKHVPFPLDLYDQRAIVSVVSFTMNSIRFPFLPAVPGLSRLNELNLRTYVEVNGQKGVYFFTLDADLWPAIFIARTFFSLPYRFAQIALHKIDKSYSCHSLGRVSSLKFQAEIGLPIAMSDFDHWATERYALFTQRSKTTLEGVVMHAPWKLQAAVLNKIEDHFSSQLGDSLKAHSFKAITYSQELKVRFRPFKKV